MNPKQISDLLPSLFATATQGKASYALATRCLTSELPRELLKETPADQLLELAGIDVQQDPWFVYYFTQFSLYQPGESEFYEAWEQVLMGFLNKDNKISFLAGKQQGLIPVIASDRYADINPTKMLLDILQGKFSGSANEYVVFALALAKELFHPEIADNLLELYIEAVSPNCEHEEFSGRLATLVILQPACLAKATVFEEFQARIIHDGQQEFVLLSEYACQRSLLLHQSTVASGIWLFLAKTEYFLNQGFLAAPEEYIRVITAKRTQAGLTDDDKFTREFKRVRQLYYNLLEKKGSSSSAFPNININGNNAIAQVSQIGQQVFGMFKGVLSAGGKATSSQSGSQSEEVKWDPVSKRWLINGQIPVDDSEPEVRGPAPPPPKKLPPPATKKDGDEANPSSSLRKPGTIAAKQKYVAYDFGSHKK